MIGEYPLPAPDRKIWVLTVKHLCGRIAETCLVLRALVRNSCAYTSSYLIKTSRSSGFVRGNRRIAHDIDRADRLATDGGPIHASHEGGRRRKEHEWPNQIRYSSSGL